MMPNLQKIKILAGSVLQDPMQIIKGHSAECSVCGYQGRFYSFTAVHPRRGARCPDCFSLERHRLYALFWKAHPDIVRNKDILLFAPEKPIRKILHDHYAPKSYVTADIAPGVADRVEDMMDLKLPDESFDAIIANHVLEHVPDDRKGMSEVYRVLRKGGVFTACVPIVEAWDQSYEDLSIQSPQEREKHFGQCDHVRFYGRDFSDRLSEAGFKVERFQASPQDCIRYGLIFGETIFVCTKH